MKKLAILGIRGLPAEHGGFETFAEYLSTHLVERGWQVTVYCQTCGGQQRHHKWQGIELIDIPVPKDNTWGTILFDIKSTIHACKSHNLLLTLGYNTGFLAIYCRLKKVKNIINMDGIEWQRSKWSLPIKAWFYLNERIASWFGNALIADHPEIAIHLASRASSKKITMIPYGAEPIKAMDTTTLQAFNIEPKGYFLIIARPEPENSILEIIKAYSARKRSIKLLVLGQFKANNRYHQAVQQTANNDVQFVGAIYDKSIVQALREHAAVYIHGHQVGGTNPSLLESMAAGNAIIAHDNRFNRWVTNHQMLYFKEEEELTSLLDKVFENPEKLKQMQQASNQLFLERYQWSTIVDQYEQLLLKFNKRGSN